MIFLKKCIFFFCYKLWMRHPRGRGQYPAGWALVLIIIPPRKISSIFKPVRISPTSGRFHVAVTASLGRRRLEVGVFSHAEKIQKLKFIIFLIFCTFIFDDVLALGHSQNYRIIQFFVSSYGIRVSCTPESRVKYLILFFFCSIPKMFDGDFYHYDHYIAIL